jgi:uncharacterized protein (TIRG00374 family)
MAAPMSVSNGATNRRRRRVRLLQAALAVVAVVVTFAVFLPSIADYGSVWDAVQSMSAAQVVLLGVVATWNILTFGPNWMVALPGLRFRQSLELNMASTAVANVVPGGSAVSFGVSWAMLREWGFERRAVALALILTGVGNNLVNVGYPLVAVALLAATGQDNTVIRQTSFLGAGLFVAIIGASVAIMHSETQALRIGQLFDRVASACSRMVRRGPVRGAGLVLVRFREDSLALLRRRWHALTIAVVVATLSVFLVLVVALRVTGVDGGEITLVEAFTAWSLVRLLTAIPITPGGVGIAELVLVGTLTQFGGDEPAVVAAVLLFRALTLLPPIFIGAIVAFTWRRHQRRITPT